MSGHESERLGAYLDGELGPDERSEVETHLAACPECSALLADLTAVDTLAASLPAEAPEGYFDTFPARVLARVGQASRAPARVRGLPAWTWAAAAALLLAVVAPLTLHRLAPGAAPTATPVPWEPPPAAQGAEQKRAREATSAPDAKPVPATRPQPAFAPPPAAAPPAAPGATAVAESRLDADKASRNEAVSEGVRVRPPPRRAPAEEDALSRSKRKDAASDSRALEEPTRVTTEAVAASESAGSPARRAPAVASAPMTSSARQDEAAGGAVSAVEPESGFGRLEAARPRTAAQWRRLRDAWAGFAAAHPDDPRADEAQVRAIEAGREAWLAARTPDDEAAFHRDAQAYLNREDAVQRERVERLLVPPRP